MRTLKILLLLSLNTALVLFSCSKSGGSNDPVKNFTWTYDGVTYSTAVDTALIQTPGPYVIIAVNGSSFLNAASRVYISPTSFAIGTYTLNAGGNSLLYIDEQGYNLAGVSGSLNITANSNSRLSGNFSATLSHPAGGTKPISGSFTNVIIK